MAKNRNQRNISTIEPKQDLQMKESASEESPENAAKESRDSSLRPNLGWDFSDMQINQHYIILSSKDHLKFLADNNVDDKEQIYISDEDVRILCTVNHVAEEIRATIHWATMQQIVVNGYDNN